MEKTHQEPVPSNKCNSKLQVSSDQPDIVPRFEMLIVRESVNASSFVRINHLLSFSISILSQSPLIGKVIHSSIDLRDSYVGGITKMRTTGTANYKCEYESNKNAHLLFLRLLVGAGITGITTLKPYSRGFSTESTDPKSSVFCTVRTGSGILTVAIFIDLFVA